MSLLEPVLKFTQYTVLQKSLKHISPLYGRFCEDSKMLRPREFKHDEKPYYINNELAQHWRVQYYIYSISRVNYTPRQE